MCTLSGLVSVWWMMVADYWIITSAYQDSRLSSVGTNVLPRASSLQVSNMVFSVSVETHHHLNQDWLLSNNVVMLARVIKVSNVEDIGE